MTYYANILQLTPFSSFSYTKLQNVYVRKERADGKFSLIQKKM